MLTSVVLPQSHKLKVAVMRFGREDVSQDFGRLIVDPSCLNPLPCAFNPAACNVSGVCQFVH